MTDQEIQFGGSGSEETVYFDFKKAEAEVDLLEDIKGQMRVRIEWLRPLRHEYDEMVAALERLEANDRTQQDQAFDRLPKRAKRQISMPKRVARKRGVGRPKGTGPRQEQVLERLRKYPGGTAADIAVELRLDRPQAHNILKKLEANGQVRQERGNKKAARWYPVEQAS